MTMEACAETQQSVETVVSESEAQQITLAQVKHIIPDCYSFVQSHLLRKKNIYSGVRDLVCK